jgi:glycosyltransferase involved in cell wall biosynthesis
MVAGGLAGRADPPLVLHVIEGLGTGGSERQLAAFLLHADRRRFRHAVCTLAQVGRFAPTVEAAGVPVYTLGLRPDGDFPRALWRFARVVRRVVPQVIHSVLYRPTVLSRAVAGPLGIPVVTTLVNTTYEPEWRLDNPRLSPAKVWAVRAVDRWTARWWGGRYVAISESVKRSAVVQLGLPAEAITVIPRGLTEELLAEPAPEAVAATRAALVGDDGPVLLCVGRLVPQKGHRYAILAMPAILQRYPRARLLIAGDGPLRGTLADLIRHLALDGAVTLLGERRDTPVLLRCADLFVFPSLFEGLGNAVLEAMAAARPLVASDIPTLREVTDGGTVALLVPPRNTDALAEGVVRLLEDAAARRRLGEAARDWTLRRFAFAPSVRALEAVLAAALPPRGLVPQEVGG